MAKKRKAPKSFDETNPSKTTRYDVEERFDDSEDEFYAGQDKILLDEAPDVKRRKRIQEQEAELQPSDEEVLAYEDEDEDEDDLSSGSDADGQRHVDDNEEEDEDDENWGTDRRDYYGDDAIETEEQAREEEAEAKRLYQKQIKSMTAADFGFDENEWAETEEQQKKKSRVTEKLPEASIPSNATTEQKLEILRARYPEFEPLVEELAALSELKAELDMEAEDISEKLKNGGLPGSGLPVSLKQNALSAYMASISMYFAVVTSKISTDSKSGSIVALPPLELHEHPVIQALARTRELWETVADEPSAIPIFPEATPVVAPEPRPTDKLGKKSKSAKTIQPVEKKVKTKRTAESRPKKAAKSNKQPKKAKPVDIADLMEESASDSASEFGDENPLTEAEYAEKAKKRKSLRFYTSQISAKANKRGQASRIAGGDDDLPHKERNRDRTERLLREAQRRGQGADELSGDSGDEAPTNRDINDEYYEKLLNAKDQKKEDKRAKAEAYARAATEGATVYEEETVGPDGKRAITYAISKNKGLMPKRKKDVRNPRVKKRKKFDEKMKKLGSVRQVYKGGEGKGGYGGELTGIKTNIVKSVKL